MGLVFPADDLLSEWTATLAVAFNDISLVHEQLESDHETPHKFFYWLRLAIAHFFEAAQYLDATSDIDEVKSFVSTLSAEAQGNYEACLAGYRTQQTPIQRLRNQAAFHYPRLQPHRANRPMKRVLERLASETGQIEKSERGTVRGSRMLFADDIAGTFFMEASGGEHALEVVHRDIEAAITSFSRFTNAALEEWYFCAQRDRGATFFELGANRNDS
jgi:hypothetical protein